MIDSEKERALKAKPRHPRRLAKARRPEGSPYRSKTEAEFAGLLELRRKAGEIVAWRHEPLRFKLGNGAWYKPDFLAQEPSGELVLYEVKGHWREAARVRIKVAASAHPEFRFVAVRKDRASWEHEEFQP